jgi:hypothetical protein
VTQKEFLDELRQQYQKGFENRTNLDGKAEGLITISATISAFFLTFGSFLVSGFERNYDLLWLVYAFLVFGIIAGIAAILLCAFVLRLQRYRYIISYEPFYKARKNKKDSFEYNLDEIGYYTKLPLPDFELTMIKEYLRSIRENTLVNKKKAIGIIYAQWIFVASIAIILGLIILLVIASNDNQFSFNISLQPETN